MTAADPWWRHSGCGPDVVEPPNVMDVTDVTNAVLLSPLSQKIAVRDLVGPCRQRDK